MSAQKTRIAINGCGRIGRTLIRLLAAHPELELVAVNDLSSPETLAHLLKWDSVHGPWQGTLKQEGSFLQIGEQRFVVVSEKEPHKLPWKEHGVEIVLECTGKFRERDKAAAHLEAGAKKVLVSAPAKKVDLTICYGINHELYDPTKHHILSNASCTTNCLAPVAKVLHENFGILKGSMTTVHSYTSDQRLLDNSHKDLRRARAAALAQIPTTTGAAQAVGLVLPELAGKLHGLAVRVPTANVSLVDLVVLVQKETTQETVHKAFQEASQGSLRGVLKVSSEPLVSVDFLGERASAVVDLPSIDVIQGNLIKVLAWYDNETGFSQRMLDVASYMGQKK